MATSKQQGLSRRRAPYAVWTGIGLQCAAGLVPSGRATHVLLPPETSGKTKQPTPCTHTYTPHYLSLCALEANFLVDFLIAKWSPVRLCFTRYTCKAAQHVAEWCCQNLQQLDSCLAARKACRDSHLTIRRAPYHSFKHKVVPKGKQVRAGQARGSL